MRRAIPVSQHYIQLKKEAYQERKLKTWSHKNSLLNENSEEEDIQSISTVEPWTDSDDDYRRQGLISSTVGGGGSFNVHKSGPNVVSLTSHMMRLQPEDEFLLEGTSFGGHSFNPSTKDDNSPKDEKLLKLEYELNSLKEQIARLVSVQTSSPINTTEIVTGMDSHLISSTNCKEFSNRMIPPPPPPPPLPCISPRTPLLISKKPHYRVSTLMFNPLITYTLSKWISHLSSI